MANTTYSEPLNLQSLMEIVKTEGPDALLPRLVWFGFWGAADLGVRP
jgi:carbamoylphosphate synthase large subunit